MGWQLLPHELVVASGQRVNGLAAHIACCHAQGGRDVTGKQVQVERDVGVGGIGHLLEKVGGERQLADGIVASLDHHHIVHILTGGFNHGQALGITEH